MEIAPRPEVNTWEKLNSLYRSQDQMDAYTAEQVLQLLDKLDDRDPENISPEKEPPVMVFSTTLKMRGDALEVLGRNDEAQKCYELAIQLFGNYVLKDGEFGKETIMKELNKKLEKCFPGFVREEASNLYFPSLKEKNGVLDEETANRLLELLDQYENMNPVEPKKEHIPLNRLRDFEIEQRKRVREEQASIIIDPCYLQMRGDTLRSLDNNEKAKECYKLAILLENNETTSSIDEFVHKNILKMLYERMESLS